MTHLKTTCTNSSNVRNISLCKNCIEKTLAKQSILYNVINFEGIPKYIPSSYTGPTSQ